MLVDMEPCIFDDDCVARETNDNVCVARETDKKLNFDISLFKAGIL